MPDTWQALYADQLMPLDERVAGWEHGATLTQKTVDMGKLANGKITMIPYGFYLRAMFYNKKLLAEAGVAGPPKTMDEFMAASEAVSKLDGKYGYCLRGGPGGTNGWIMMAAVMNGTNEFFTEDGQSRLNEPGSVEGSSSSWTSTRRAMRRRTRSTGASTRSWRASIPAPAPSSTRTPTR